MALLSRLRRLLRQPVPASRVGSRRPGRTRHADTSREDELRAGLADDPNDSRSFGELAAIVRRHAPVPAGDGDPLTAPLDDTERQRVQDLAVWALAEELAGHPRAWYPLVELARLSVDDDREGALRRLATAVERDPSGAALVEALAVLRAAKLPVEALGLGVGHWRAREHTPEVARQLVLAALEADRPAEARHHLASLDLHPDQVSAGALKAELARTVTEAGQPRTRG